MAVVNNGGDLKAALEDVRTDAADSECTWKVLVVHEPIYGTVEEMDAETRVELTAIIEEAGIDFVFTGDDHAFARTVPLKGDVEVEAEDGVVYYICGDLSGKDNEFHGDRSYFARRHPPQRIRRHVPLRPGRRQQNDHQRLRLPGEPFGHLLQVQGEIPL